MFAVIASPQYWKQIEETVLSDSGQIVFKKIADNVENIHFEIEGISRTSIKILIIDITVIEDKISFIKKIRSYRIMRDQTRIIILAPNCLPGNEVISKLVTMGIYDIIAPLSESEEKIEFSSCLLEHLKKPASYAKAVRWDIGSEINSEERKHIITKDKKHVEREVVERTVTIEREKIIGTVIIAVAGSMQRIGTTHTSISIANFLKSQNFKVGAIELYKRSFLDIKNTYEDIKDFGKFFVLEGVDYYPYDQDLKVLDVLQKDYQYLVLDMGIYSKCNLEEFKRANERIILSGVKDWELTDLEIILRTGDAIFKNKYFFTFSDKPTFNEIKKSMDKLKCYLAPYNPIPFFNTKETDLIYKDLLKDVLPETVSSNNKGKFLSFLKSRGI